MENFTPVSAALGGALIGLSAVLLMASIGRIAGISGIVSGALVSGGADRVWRLLFLAGLILAPLFYALLAGQRPAFDLDAGPALIVAGGLLVGFGTRLGSGCTSGHGVCGLSRLSPRSLVSVVLFMGTGMVTVALARAVMGN